MNKNEIKKELKELFIFNKNNINEIKILLNLVNEKAFEVKNRLKVKANDAIRNFISTTRPELLQLEKNVNKRKGLDGYIDNQFKYVEKYCPNFSEELSDLGFPYSDKIIKKMVLVYCIILFEEMVKENLRLFFHCHIRQLMPKNSNKEKKAEKSLDYETILSARNIEELKNIMIDEELYRLGFNNIDGIEKYFSKRMKITFSEDLSNWSNLRSAYYIRNIVVHNRCIMNKKTFDKIKLGNVGEQFNIPMELINNLHISLKEFNEYLYNKMNKKLKV